MINLIILLFLFFGAIYAVLKYLDSYSLHGQSITVPNFKGFKINELDEFIADKDLRYTISDSVYNTKMPKGTVVEQTPRPNSLVKKDRNIYLTVNATRPPMVALPNLIDLSMRQAIGVLESYGLKLGEQIYKPNPYYQSVLGVEIDEKEIKAGKMLEIGATINLVLGKGESNQKILLPDLTNLTLNQIISVLKSKGLNIGSPVYNGCITVEDSAKARVYKQIPTYEEDALINLGHSIDIFFICDSSITSVKNNNNILKN